MDQKVSKSQLIEEIANEQEVSRMFTKEIIDLFMEKIEEAVVNGDSVTLQGFGRIYSRETRGRAFRKINSEDFIDVGSRVLPKIKFSKKFVERVKGT